MTGSVSYTDGSQYSLGWLNERIADVQNWSWLFSWGMYLFLIATAAILFWVFYDSITKKKDQKALIPRILSMVGFFAIIPAFIFKFTGNIDASHQLILSDVPQGTPGPVAYNAQWLLAGYGPTIALITLLGVLLAIAAIVIYASSVQRSKPSTEFVQAFNSKMDNLESKVEDAKRNAAAANAAAASVTAANAAAAASAATAAPAAAPRPAASNATIIDRKPQAATIIDVPKTGDTLTVQAGQSRGNTYDLPANDITIGRDPKCYIVIDDGKVSREHVKLCYSLNGWSVLDLGSANGTYLNDQRLAGQQALSNGDRVKIGDTVLVFGSAQ